MEPSEKETCSWDGCTSEAEFPQIASDGERWAHLCAVHEAEINSHIDQRDAKGLLSAWVKAQGGSRGAMRRILR